MSRSHVSRTTMRRLYSTLTAGIGGTLCVSLAAAPCVFAAPPAAARHTVRTAAELTPDQQVLHALNRFTFGPRPGEEAAVAAMGLDAWFDRQLHPERIPDTALEARLARFPAMQLPQDELLARFPSPGMLRQYNRGALDGPGDPTEATIYADAAFNQEHKRKGKALAETEGVKPAQANGSASMAPEATGGKIVSPGNALPAAQAAADPEETVPPMSRQAVEGILALPPAERMRRLLAFSPEEMQAFRATLKGRDPQLVQGLAPAQAEQVVAMQAPIRMVGAEAMATRLLRDVYSERQLQAVMADFWLNHFNIYLRKNQDEPYLLPAYARETILPHSLGRFEDLLIATAESPAMLVYLDNWTSVGPHSRAAERTGRVPQQTATGQPATVGKIGGGKFKDKGINENYARELMELHTLGVSGGYTQADVIEVAKCFTGWTIGKPADGAEFTFNPNRHEPGPKTLLGHKIAESGEAEGLAVLHLLAYSPRTAHFLAEKLAERFVSDTPPPALVERMADAYLRHDTDIGATLEAMYHSPEFWSAAVYRAKVKTPVEFVASALRAGEAQVTNPIPLTGALERLGMPVYGMQTPNGYSWRADAWVSSSALLNRLNLALVLSGNKLGGTAMDWKAVLGDGETALGASSEGTELALERVILGQPAAPKTRAAVLEQAEDPATQETAEAEFGSVPAKVSTMQNAGAGRTGLTRIGLEPPDAPNANGPDAAVAAVAATAGLLLGSPDFQRR